MFDYAALDAEDRAVLRQRTRTIRALMVGPAADIVTLGQRLLLVKRQLGHDRFGQWAKLEFSWSQEAAWRFLLAAQQYGDAPWTLESAPSVLGVVAAPAAATTARLETVARALAGERMTYFLVHEILDRHGALGLTVGDMAELTGIEII